MINMKALAISTMFVIVLLITLGIIARRFFGDWSSENDMALAITCGVICGIIYPFIAKKMEP